RLLSIVTTGRAKPSLLGARFATRAEEDPTLDKRRIYVTIVWPHRISRFETIYRMFSTAILAGLSPVAGVLTLWLANPAHAQPLPLDTATSIAIGSPSLLPDTGTPTDSDNLRQQLMSLDAVGPEKTAIVPGWIFTPSISIKQEWTDHIQGAGNGSSFVTVGQPGIFATGDTSRLHSVISYTPNAEFFTPSGDQN